MTKPRPETPKFFFERKRDIEIAHHWILAGVLTVDIPKTPDVQRHRPAIDRILARLIMASQKGTLPADETLGGWPADATPMDENVLKAWIENSITVLVRVRIRDDGHLIAEIRPPVAEDECTLNLGRPTLH
jgi:hypothetical protein